MHVQVLPAPRGPDLVLDMDVDSVLRYIGYLRLHPRPRGAAEDLDRVAHLKQRPLDSDPRHGGFVKKSHKARVWV